MAAAEFSKVSPNELWANLSERSWQVGLTDLIDTDSIDPDLTAKNLIDEEERVQSKCWVEQVCDRRQQLARHTAHTTHQPNPLVIIAESDSADYLACFWAAVLARWDVALASPHWGLHEWRSAVKQLQPTLVWGDRAHLSGKDLPLPPSDTPQLDSSQSNSQPGREPAILISTGGSSGQVKFACHTWASLVASASGFCQYFTPQGEPINVCCVLPVYHVSGLMQVLRAWLSDGQVVVTPFKQLLKQLEIGTCCRFQGWFISLVPTQLEQLLQANQGAWLCQFHAVLLGGAPPWPTLLARAFTQQIPLCLSYGMTETAAMVTALLPAEFLQGRISSGRSLPHVTLQIVNSDQPGFQPLPPGEVGQIVVQSAATAERYFSVRHSRGSDGGSDGSKSSHGAKSRQFSSFSPHVFYTDDLGYLSADGHLHITGRASSKIISGGENIFPAEVEAAIRATNQVRDVCVVGWPHPHWGEAVIAAYVPTSAEVCPKSLQQALLKPTSQQLSPSQHSTGMLSRYKHPKYWFPFEGLPRNAQGKLNRQQLLAHLQQRVPLGSLVPLSSPLAQRSIPDGGDRVG